jgi:tripartite-type tricarboxylate transporter receptor subunit TctC
VGTFFVPTVFYSGRVSITGEDLTIKFNFARDIAAVAPMSRGLGVLVVHPSLLPKSVPELITYAKSIPGKVTVASAGIGSAPHMYWELFRNVTGVNMLHVPYRGGGPALTDLLGGQVQVYFGTSASTIRYLRRILVVGAHSVLRRVKHNPEKYPWLTQLLAR